MVRVFYDERVPHYHLLFEDWETSIERQGALLDGIIRSEWGERVCSVRDVTCGMGTQAIGLAQRGYPVEASDLSLQAIERAKEETDKRGLTIHYTVSDMRKVATQYAVARSRA